MTERGRLLELALKGLEAERAKINAEIAQIRGQLNSGRSSAGITDVAPASATGLKKRRTMSEAARRKISESMKRRYAEMKRAAKK
jgi:hypothetical protein